MPSTPVPHPVPHPGPPATRAAGAGQRAWVLPGILALALGGFAIGTTEFAIMGLLPQAVADLGVDLPAGGILISSYALGVVVIASGAGLQVPAAAGAGLAAVGCLLSVLLLRPVRATPSSPGTARCASRPAA